MPRGNQKRLAARAAGKPGDLKFTRATSDGESVSAVPVAGLGREDILVSVLHFGAPASSGSAVYDLTTVGSITAPGTVSLGGSVPAADSVLVIWYDV